MNLVIVKMHRLTIEERLRVGFLMLDNSITGKELVERERRKESAFGTEGSDLSKENTKANSGVDRFIELMKVNGLGRLIQQVDEFITRLITLGVTNLYQQRDVDIVRPIDIPSLSQVNKALSLSLDPIDVELNAQKKKIMSQKIANPTLSDLLKLREEMGAVLQKERGRRGRPA